MVVGRSCAAGVLPVLEPASDGAALDALPESVLPLSLSLLPLLSLVLCELVCAGAAEDEVELGARFKDWVLAYQ